MREGTACWACCALGWHTPTCRNRTGVHYCLDLIAVPRSRSSSPGEASGFCNYRRWVLKLWVAAGHRPGFKCRDCLWAHHGMSGKHPPTGSPDGKVLPLLRKPLVTARGQQVYLGLQRSKVQAQQLLAALTTARRRQLSPAVTSTWTALICSWWCCQLAGPLAPARNCRSIIPLPILANTTRSQSQHRGTVQRGSPWAATATRATLRLLPTASARRRWAATARWEGPAQTAAAAPTATARTCCTASGGRSRP